MNHLLSIGDNDRDFLQHILQQSRYLHTNPSIKTLEGKNILFSFEKPSLRTLVASEVAINKLGGNVLHVSPEAFLGGKVMHPADLDIDIPEERESLKDTVKNVSRWCDAIFARVYQHQTLTTLASFSEIPIVNALSELHHPMQALADLYTIRQKLGDDAQHAITFVGDANNVAYSLIEIGLLFGHNLTFASPPAYGWRDDIKAHFNQLATTHGGVIRYVYDAQKAVEKADVVYTDAFVSMGEEHLYDEKLKAFGDFKITESLMQHAPDHAGFMHCLPAHRGVEVTDAVLDAPNSWIYDQAENRMVTSLGVFTALLTGN